MPSDASFGSRDDKDAPHALTELVGRLNGLLPDDFSRRMLAGSISALNDNDNLLRLTFFSIGIREMVGHLLTFLAPDANVTQCSWFAQEHETITRRQRAKYIVQGGLSDDFLQSVNIDMNALYGAVRPKIDALSRYVHVREATADIDQLTIDGVVHETIAFLIELLTAIATCRTLVTDALEEQLHSETVMALISENLDHVDVISSSHSVEEVYIFTARIMAIDHETVTYIIDGEVGIEFHWGPSNDGINGSESFLFKLKTWSFIDDLGKFEEVELDIDTEDWHRIFEPDPDDR